jgi:RNA recognition motif-containing protein
VSSARAPRRTFRPGRSGRIAHGREDVHLNKKIYVGNLPFTSTEAELRALFEPYGDVERVNLITDRDSGRPRGFAFVVMTDSTQADAATRGLDGRNVGGRALRVSEATDRTAAAGGGRGARL